MHRCWIINACDDLQRVGRMLRAPAATLEAQKQAALYWIDRALVQLREGPGQQP